jgi:hypothetical protein
MANQNNYAFNVEFNNFEYYKTPKGLKNNVDDFIEFNKTLILFSENLIEILNEIKASGISQINNFNFSSDKLY